MPAKPGKYGILFRVMTDARQRYVARMLAYCGRAHDNDTTERQSAAAVVMELSRHILGTGRNIATDRYYTVTDDCSCSY